MLKLLWSVMCVFVCMRKWVWVFVLAWLVDYCLSAGAAPVIT